MLGGGILRGGLNLMLGQAVRPLDDRALERVFGSAPVVRLLAEAMARGYRPEISPGFRGTVLYTLTKPLGGGAPVHIALDVFGKSASADYLGASAELPAAVVHVQMPVADFARVAAGRTDPAEPLLHGRATFTGDLGVAARLPEMFGAPKLS